MAYGTKYRYQYYSKNLLCQVDLEYTGYSSSVIPIVLGGSPPVTISCKASKSDTLDKSIKGTTLTFNFALHPNDISIYEELAESNYKDWRISFYVNNTLRWQGWLKSENCVRDFITNTYSQIQLSAIDAIGDLKEIDYINGSNVYTDKVSSIQHLTRVINETDLSLDWKVQCNTWERYTMNSSDCVYTKAKVSSMRFYDIDNGRTKVKRCDDVANEILTPFNSELFQARGKWWIVNFQEPSSYVYDISWGYYTSTARNANQLYLDLTGYKYDDRGSAEKIRPLKSVNLTHYNKNATMNENTYFVQDGGFNLGTGEWNNYGGFYLWRVYPGIDASEFQNQYNDVMRPVSPTDDGSTHSYTNPTPILQINNDNTDKIKVSYKVRVNSLTFDASIPDYYKYVNVYCRVFKGNDPLTGTEVYPVSGSGFIMLGTGDTTWQNQSWEFYLSGHKGSYQNYVLSLYTFHISPLQWSDYQIADIRFDDVSAYVSNIWPETSAGGYTYDVYYNHNGTDTTVDQLDQTIYLGDSYKSRYNDIGAFTINSSTTSSWNRYNKTDQQSLQYIYSKNLLERYGAYKDYIKLKIEDPNDNIAAYHVLKINGRYYRIIGYEEEYWGTNSGSPKVWNVELEEVLTDVRTTSLGLTQLTSINGQGGTSSSGASIDDSGTSSGTTWSSSKIDTTKADTTALAAYIKSASTGTSLYWHSGLLDVSSGGSGVSQSYVDGSLSTRDSSISNIMSNYWVKGIGNLTNTNSSIGIGTSTPRDILEIASPNSQLRLTDTDDSSFGQFSYSQATLAFRNNLTATSSTGFFFRNQGIFGNFGIGVFTPVERLQVGEFTDACNNYIRIQVANTSNYTPGIKLGWGGSDFGRFDFPYDTRTIDGLKIGTYGAYPFSVWTNSSKRIHINYTGETGIGTEEPSTLLHIDDSNTSREGIIISNDTSTVNSRAGIKIKCDFDSSYGVIQMRSGYATYIPGAFQLGATTPISLNAGLGATPTMYLLTNGSVGIGTTTPNNLLEISTTATGTTSNQLMVTSQAATSGVAGIIFNTPYSGTDHYASITSNWYSANAGMTFTAPRYISTSPLFKWLGPDTSEFMRISNAGYVGIGTTTPLAKLHVVQSVNTIENNAFFGTSDGSFGLWIGNATNFGYQPVIIGDSSDSNDVPIYIVGRIYPAQDTGTTPAILLDGRRKGDTSLTTRPLLGISNAGSIKITVDDAGQIGVGTTTPTSLLHLISPISAYGQPLFVGTNDGSYGLSLGNFISPGYSTTIFTDSSTSVAQSFYLLSRIWDTDDSGTTPVITLNARKRSGAVIATRPLFSLANYSSTKLIIGADGSVFFAGDVSIQGQLRTKGNSIVTYADTSVFHSGDVSIQGKVTTQQTFNTSKGVIGYTINVMATQYNPSTGIVYFGTVPRVPSPTDGSTKVYIRRPGTITMAEIMSDSSVTGSAFDVSVFIRLNSTTDTFVGRVNATTKQRYFTNTALNITVNASDYFEIKVATPVWTGANPTWQTWGGYVFIQQ